MRERLRQKHGLSSPQGPYRKLQREPSLSGGAPFPHHIVRDWVQYRPNSSTWTLALILPCSRPSNIARRAAGHKPAVRERTKASSTRTEVSAEVILAAKLRLQLGANGRVVLPS